MDTRDKIASFIQEMGEHGKCIRYHSLYRQGLSAYQDYARVYKTACKPNISPVERLFLRDVYLGHIKRVKRLERDMKFIASGKKGLDISAAKCYPIGDLIELDRFGKGICPWHEDTKPSLSVKNNKAKCFVCGEGGDAIDVYQAVYKCSWRESVKRLGG